MFFINFDTNLLVSLVIDVVLSVVTKTSLPRWRLIFPKMLHTVLKISSCNISDIHAFINHNWKELVDISCRYELMKSAHLVILSTNIFLDNDIFWNNNCSYLFKKISYKRNIAHKSLTWWWNKKLLKMSFVKFTKIINIEIIE